MKATVTCPCGAPLPPRKGPGGLPQKWCSESCRVFQYRPTKPAPRECGYCGVASQMRPNQVYCSKTCAWRGAGARRRLPQIFTCGGCEAAFEREPTRGQRPKWCEDCRGWNPTAKANWQVRRARKFGGDYETFTYLEIFERDGWCCGVCGESVDRSLAHPDHYSASLDHIVPLSEGGDHTRANSRCAHLICNIRRGNRGGTEQLRLVG